MEEMCAQLLEAYHEQARSTVNKRISDFQSERSSTEDADQPGKPSEIDVTNRNVV